MWRDLRYAAHALRRSPVFLLSTTTVLGIAIGANATIFGLVDALWFRPPGITSPEEIVRIFSTTAMEREGTWSFPEYAEIRDHAGASADVVARGRRGAVMKGADGAQELLLVNVVSMNFFQTMGVGAAQGRLFAPGDERELEAQPALILGHAFWQRRFGSDPSIIGRTIVLDRGSPLAVSILGVLPASFRDLDAAADRDLWIPPATWAQLANQREFEARTERWFDVLARRRRGVGVQSLDARIAALAAGMAREHPDINAGRGGRVISDLTYRLDSGGVNARALLGLVLLVMLITCVNVASLLLARGAGRAREIAVRAAIGATRLRLVRQLLTESALLGCLGAAAGLILAMWLIRLLPAILTAPPGFRSFLLFETDSRVVLFTLGVTAITTLLFGVAPAWIAARSDVAATIRADSIRVGARRREGRAWRSLLTVQVAISLTLLCAAGVLARSFIETSRADLGISRKPLLTIWATQGSTPAATVEGLRRLEALPGIRAVGVAIRAPLSLSGGGMAQPVYLPHAPASQKAGLPEVKFNAVSANYFAVLGTRILRGRAFDDADQRAGDPVMLINERFASQFFPGVDPLGGMVRLGGAQGTDHRVVGIAQNAVINQIGEPPEPYFYLPYWRGRYGEITFLVETPGDAAALAAAARDALKAVDRALEPRRLIPLGQYIDHSASIYRATAVLAVALAFIGLLLTAIGVYGSVAYRTARRTREIGIRLALGAARAQVLRMVLHDGIRVWLAGVAIGLPAAMIATRLLSSLLFGVSPWDVGAFGTATAVLFLGVCGTTLIPAWRATRVSASDALRDA